jgi:hypothetical protein
MVLKKLNMKKIALLLIGFLFIVSCEETEPTLFNGETFVSFLSNASDLPVTIDDVGSVAVRVSVTTLASVDRTLAVEVSTSSSADPQNYTVPPTVTIPANEYFADIQVTGVDNSVEITPETIILSLGGIDGGTVSSTTHTISIFQVCPVPTDYLVGDYSLTDFGNGNFGTDVPVTISIPTDEDGDLIETQRTFVAVFLPATGVAREVNVILDLVCNTVFLREIDINVTCTQDTSYLITSAGSQSSSYDVSDDSFLEVNYLEDPEADCGPAVIQNFTLTRI